MAVFLPRPHPLRPSGTFPVLMPCSKSGRDAVGRSWCPAVNALACPWKPLKSFPVGSTWAGRLAAAPHVSERILFLPLGPDTMGKCALARPASSCSCVPSAPWTPARSPRRAHLFLREDHRLLLTGLSLTHGKFCFPELARDQARDQSAQGRARSRCGERHMLGRFLGLLWDTDGAPGPALGSHSAPWCSEGDRL